MAETEFRERETSAQNNGQPQHGLQGVEQGMGRGAKGGSRDRGHHKELNKKDMTWLLRDS
jgi:hypothetical protein